MKGLTNVLKLRKCEKEREGSLPDSSNFDKKSVESGSGSMRSQKRYIPQNYRSMKMQKKRAQKMNEALADARKSFSRFSTKSNKKKYGSFISPNGQKLEYKRARNSSTSQPRGKADYCKRSLKFGADKGNELNSVLINNIKTLTQQNKELKERNKKIMALLKKHKIVFTSFEGVDVVIENLEKHFVYIEQLKKRLELQNHQVHQLKDSLRKNKAFEKYYPEHSKQIIVENEKSSNSTVEEQSEFSLQSSPTNKPSEFTQLMSINKKLGFIPSNFDFEIGSISKNPKKDYQRLLENSSLMERNIENLKSYMKKKGLEEDIIQYISYVLELMKTENDSYSVKYAQLMSNFEAAKSKFEKVFKKMEGYKSKWKLSNQKLEILNEKTNFFEKKYLDLESESLPVKEYQLEIEKLKNLLEFKEKEISLCKKEISLLNNSYFKVEQNRPERDHEFVKEIKIKELSNFSSVGFRIISG
jgi:hypothetical protein